VCCGAHCASVRQGFEPLVCCASSSGAFMLLTDSLASRTKPLISKEFWAKRPQTLKPCFRGLSRASTLGVAPTPRAVHYGAVEGSGLNSLFAGPHKGSFSWKEPPVPLFSVARWGQSHTWGRGPHGAPREWHTCLFRRCERNAQRFAFLLCCNGSVCARVHGDFGTAGPGRCPSH
jgi:hypothetical protein